MFCKVKNYTCPTLGLHVMDIMVLPQGVKRLGRVANTNFHLVSSSRTIGAIPLLPLYTFMAWTGEIYSLFTVK